MIAADPAAVSTPPACEVPAPASAEHVALSRRQDRLHVAFDGAEPVPARLVLMRPISEPGGMLAVLGQDLRCLAEIASLDELAPASRLIAAEELRRRYCVPEILAVLGCQTEQGNRYLRVGTDRGDRQLLFRDPERDLTWVSPDHAVLRDVQGNRFRIASLSRLDSVSREALLSML